MKIALTANALITPLERIEQGILICEDGKILALGSRSEIAVPSNAQHIDFGDAVLAPGFIDIHIHGGAGHDVMEASPSALSAIEEHLAKTGVTSYCPTTVTAPIDTTLFSLERLGKAIRQGGRNGLRARPVGLHLEGPFISTAKCGVHPVKDILPPSMDLLRKFLAASGETVRMMTVAPELPQAQEFIAEAVSRNVRISLGHSNATAEEARNTIAAGASHATHTFNAMRPLGHRDPGIVGTVLSDGRVSADIIADGIHVAPELIKIFLAAKGSERAVLITDAISATGKPDGIYRLGTFEVEVKNGRCTAGGRLAGSVLTMDKAVRNIMTYAEWSLQNSVTLATINPATALGIADTKGSLEVGKDADLAVLTPRGELVRTIVAGIV